MAIFKKGYFWIVLFVLIFLLSQDYWYVQWPEQLGWLGFPVWLWCFGGFHVLLIIAIYFFAKQYWKE